MRFTTAAAPLLAATLVASLKLPAIQRKIEDITAADKSPLARFKRDGCVYGNLASYQCCSDSFYCLASEFCAGNNGYCCPTGTTYIASSEECQLPSGTYDDALPDFEPWAGSALTTTMSGGTYYATVITVHFTEWTTSYNYGMDVGVLTSYTDEDETTMYTMATDSASAASYFNSRSSSLVSMYNSYCASQSEYYARSAAVAASIVTLTTPVSTSAAPTNVGTTATGSAASHSSSSTSKASSSTASSSSAAPTGASGNSTSPAPKNNAAMSVNASGMDLIFASGFTLFAMGSALSALLL